MASIRRSWGGIVSLFIINTTAKENANIVNRTTDPVSFIEVTSHSGNGRLSLLFSEKDRKSFLYADFASLRMRSKDEHFYVYGKARSGRTEAQSMQAFALINKAYQPSRCE
jgi:hypothetical protein